MVSNPFEIIEERKTELEVNEEDEQAKQSGSSIKSDNQESKVRVEMVDEQDFNNYSDLVVAEVEDVDKEDEEIKVEIYHADTDEEVTDMHDHEVDLETREALNEVQNDQDDWIEIDI